MATHSRVRTAPDGWPSCDGRNLRLTILRCAAGILVLTQSIGLLVTGFLLTDIPTIIKPTHPITAFLPLELVFIVAAAGGLIILLGYPLWGGTLVLTAGIFVLESGGLFLIPGAVMALLSIRRQNSKAIIWSGLALTGCLIASLALHFDLHLVKPVGFPTRFLQLGRTPSVPEAVCIGLSLTLALGQTLIGIRGLRER